MRLLHTSTDTFEEFFDSDIPRYAILSHRWSRDEVSFQEYEGGTKMRGSGYIKIQKSRKIAAADGYDWIWIDTCCIDKKSSAELSEAINSMFTWYGNAEVCYAYLNDVHPSEQGVDLEEDFSPWADSFHHSEWFTRGWTLQELLAPREVMFFDGNWERIGTRATLSEEIEAITGIDSMVLRIGFNGRTSCIAQRMCWAAHRNTSRIEDIAYCLMGIFDINMPLLYGEGTKAFKRLQEEIIRQSDDESIFAWRNDPGERIPRHDLLAPSPLAFAHCLDIRSGNRMVKSNYSITNRGLQMETLLREHPEGSGQFVLPLNCSVRERRPLALELVKIHQYYPSSNEEFIRVDCIEISPTVKDEVRNTERRSIDITWSQRLDREVR